MGTGSSGPPQKRALFYVFDAGTGVGHLRRLSSIARQLQGRFSCLVVTGHRAAAHWFVPEECEYVHLPSWDSLLEAKARYWGREPFVAFDKRRAIRLRREILRGVVRGFQPDAIFVDHLPLGAEEELSTILKNTRCRKYFVTRGVLNETEDLRRLILGSKAHHYLMTQYDRIFVAADSKVVDFARQYNLPPELRAKTLHTGYVAQGISPELIARARADRGLGDDDVWVVASAGGGQMGERLIAGCLELASKFKNVAFDIVMGPRSKLTWPDPHRTVIVRERLHLHKEAAHMPYLNASADLVISSGGYNTLQEALQGKANILCFPYRTDLRDEQYQHAVRLQRFVNLKVSVDLSELEGLFARALRELGRHRRADRRDELDRAGAANIERIVLADLGIEPNPTGARR
ncbi:glycosyltransferase [Corallococcus caeni]|uniref:glycosyltransferase n=1 Tax=Corallococcus caeni TaxID=3082388 RepID=UPI00295710BF|nr:glycosyltransferase [Corallococcus sp. KH5-1]